MKSFIFRFTLAAFALCGAFTLHAQPVLIGNAGLAGQSLDADAIKAVLLGKKTTLGDTRAIIVIVKDSAAQEQFLKDNVAMTTSQFQNHWRRLFMTGGGSAPKVVGSEAEATKLLAETPGAIAITDQVAAGSLPVLSK